MDAPRPITPPGWYDDGHGQLRWYDGSQWTQHTAPLTRPAAPQAPAQPAAQPRAQVRSEELVRVKRSKLVWILPVVFVVAALVGALSAVALWSSGTFDSEPLERTYADFTQAESSQDCAALVAVTTQSFRDDLYDERFTCASLTTRPPVSREGDPVWGLRLGSVGILVVEESGGDDLDDEYDLSSSETYTFIREDGRWKLDGSD
ncbi:DUF2510 domain-containing protein [Aeromicrobium choanae]|nr:DUF2510 domain-containing protein [Aeromicrobium choanae]